MSDGNANLSHYRAREFAIDLKQFVPWGAPVWKKFVATAVLTNEARARWKGKRVLEVGGRDGRMASLFALLGAEVTSVDISPGFIDHAQLVARRFGVENSVRFTSYDGDLDVFEDFSFDAVFSKSVLVVVPKLDNFLAAINRKLNVDGEVIFIENGYGNFFLHALRVIHHRKWNCRSVNYFTDADLDRFRNAFDAVEIQRNAIPPVFLIRGKKRT